MTTTIVSTPPLPERRAAAPKTYPVMSYNDAIKLVKQSCGNIYVAERHGSGRNKVLILPEAYSELTHIISYGRRSPMNRLEQKFIGLGHFLIDEKKYVTVVVSHFIELLTTNRSSVGAHNLGPNGEPNAGLDFLDYLRDQYIQAEEQYNTDAYGFTVDPFLQICGSSEFVLEGHTHPDLGVFFSGPDRESGSARAAVSPVCVFVCDPIRKKMLGAVGHNLAAAEVIVFARHSDKHSDGMAGQLTAPAGELARLSELCLAQSNCSGNIKYRALPCGSVRMQIKLTIPKQTPKKGGPFRGSGLDTR